MVRVLETTSPDMREQILRAVASPRLRYWITDETALDDANAGTMERWLAASLEDLLPESPRAPVRVHVTPAETLKVIPLLRWRAPSIHRGDRRPGTSACRSA